MKIRTGQGDFPLPRAEFERRFRAQFADPAFDDRRDAIDALLSAAWDGYHTARKSPVTRKAGEGFADPHHDLSVDWLATREAIQTAESQRWDPTERARVLLVCASPRNDKTCPGELSKTFRLAATAHAVLESLTYHVDLLDLSELTAEYGKVIYPCKGCVSTAMPLCHWPCSCYPNHSLGQVNDWMSEIYPRWTAAHGVMIITPVHWYQAPTVLKSMIDRLVCADGGNADPTTTHGKKAAEAKALELEGWAYPKHLAGRSYSVIVHGDVEGAENLRRMLCDWLSSLDLVPAGSAACLDRYIGYYGPYATSHQALDEDRALTQEVENAARALATHIDQVRAGRQEPDAHLAEPRPK